MTAYVTVTFFDNYAATTKREERLTLTALAELIRTTDADTKEGLPWLKCGHFGDLRTNKGSLRHNANLLAITGVEGDADSGEISLDAAIQLLSAAGILVLIYTSPSHTEDAPRWRAICPLSQEYQPDQRDRFMGRLNGVLRGVLANESWTLSQSYYHGSVRRNPSHQVMVIEGEFIDLADHLDAAAIGKPVRPRPNGDGRHGPATRPEDITDARIRGLVESLLDNLRNAADGSKHHTLFAIGRTLGGYIHLIGWSEQEAVEQLLGALPPSVEDWHAARKTAAQAVALGATQPLELEDRPNPRLHCDTDRPMPDATRQDPEPPDDGEKQHPANEGKPKRRARTNNILALVTYINTTPAWDGVLRFNLLTENYEICLPFPPQDGAKGPPRPLRDPHDLLTATLYFQASGFPKANKHVVWDAIAAVAHQSACHPVRDYLSALRWDGVGRVNKLFEHYFNAEVPGQDRSQERDRHVAYLEQISTGFLVGAVARVMQPGCKQDHVPVVVGKERLLKSSAIRALCHDDKWFSDDISPNLIERDTKESLSGKWIIELAEIPHIRREAERVKAFFSRRDDRYRSAYGKVSQDHPRQCVFIGSSNNLEFVDVTGNRRFWPFRVAGQIDVAAIITDRDQLWAEAMALYRQAVPWWLSPNIEAIAAEQQAGFVESDLWEDLIADWLKDHPNPFTMKHLFAKDTGITPYRETSAVSRADEMRAGRCLAKLGWTKRQQTISGLRAWWWECR